MCLDKIWPCRVSSQRDGVGLIISGKSVGLVNEYMIWAILRVWDMRCITIAIASDMGSMTWPYQAVKCLPHLCAFVIQNRSISNQEVCCK